MKRVLILLLLLSSGLSAQTLMTLPQIQQAWAPGQVPRGDNNSNTWYTLFNQSSVDNGKLYFTDVATTTTLAPVTYNTNTLTFVSNGRISTIDGYTLTLNTRLLVKNQVAALQNGIYYMLDTGTVSTKAKLVRDSLYNEASEIYPSQVNVLNGATNASKYFLQTTSTLTVGVSPIVYSSIPAPSNPYSVGENLISIYPLTWKNSPSFVWQRVLGTSSVTLTSVVATGTMSVPTGYAHQFKTAETGTIIAAYAINQFISVNTNLTYYGKIWAAQTSGTGKFYCGYIAYDKNLNILNGNGGSFGYFIANNVNPSSTGIWYYGKISGEGVTVSKFPVGTRYIKPLIYVNYNTGGTTQVGGFEISEVPFEQYNNTYDIAVGGTSKMVITPTTTAISNTLNLSYPTASTYVGLDANKNVISGSINAGSGISIGGTAPNYTISATGTTSITAGTNISITGSIPSFTVSTSLTPTFTSVATNTLVAPVSTFTTVNTNTLTTNVLVSPTITATTIATTSLSVTSAMLPVIQSISTSTITPDNTKNTGSYASSSTAFSIVNPSSAFADGQGYLLIISDNGVARAITFGASYVAMAQALPTTTNAGKRMAIYFVYNSTYGKYLTWYSNEQ